MASGSPAANSASWLRTRRRARGSIALLLPPTWGVSSRRGADHSGWSAGSGSGSTTSRAALLVNVSRGSVVDTDALLAELTSGRLRAALDVTVPEPLPPGHSLWSAPGLLLTPHVGGYVREWTAVGFAAALDQIARYAAGQPLQNVIGDRGY